MTDKNKTEIVVVLDRSGSMSSIKKDMEGGFATFVAEQKAIPGECLMSLYQFDSDYEAVYEGKPIGDVPALSLVPRGSTALLDALGRSVAAVGERLSKLPEEKRPGAVIVLVITDGHENSSREYKREQIKQIITRQEKEYAWKFVYLGADAGAFNEAQSMGINTAAQYQADSFGTHALYNATSRSVGEYRKGIMRGASASSLSVNIPKDLRPESKPDETP